jgi:CheY-like chemotaxis protein
MPNGGELKIETSNVYLDEKYTRGHIGSRPGNFVQLSVTDTGVGITEEQQEHVFEPFYTTKENAKGTGLGLATVYGIVKQSDGHIWVNSEVGVGSTFRIYLPRVFEAAPSQESTEPHERAPGGEETLLLVEDEEAVRNLTREILAACGYKVIAVENASEALEILNREMIVDLLLTDVVMPEMSGPQLAETAVEIRPGIKVLYMSGYTNDAVFRKGVTETDRNFIKKPFTYDSLAQKVRQMLDS